MTTTIALFHGELTDYEADVIVNATNSSLFGGSGGESEIHSAGGHQVVSEVQHIRDVRLPDGLATGEVVSTNAGDLPAKWVVHTVGPVFDADEDRSQILRDCYVKAMELADKLGAFTIAFPMISGNHDWPIADAARIAVNAVASTTTHLTTATFVVDSDEAYAAFVTAREEAIAAGYTE